MDIPKLSDKDFEFGGNFYRRSPSDLMFFLFLFDTDYVKILIGFIMFVQFSFVPSDYYQIYSFVC